VVKEIEEYDGAIMFIDEIHTVIGAGATSGGAMDASNLLKPALSSGACAASGRPPTRNIASTSKRTARWCAGSRKSTSTSRRCRCDQDPEGLKPYFEDFHKVKYTNDAIKQAVELSRATSMTASCRTRRST
jgi:ATP-dependent Clp protease ATP-binding subunit ClpA